MTFGTYIRSKREAKFPGESLRQFVHRVGVSAGYLSGVERDLEKPTEALTRRLADVLEEDPDLLLTMTGQISRELQEVISARPEVFAEVIKTMKQLKDAPDYAILKVVRVVRDGNW